MRMNTHKKSVVSSPSSVFTLMNSEITPRVQWVEVSTSLQIPSFQIIGLPGPEVSEAKERIKSAIENSGLTFPRRKVILNLSPASVRKQGTGLDLAMAMAILIDSNERKKAPVYRRIFAWGELGLSGQLKSVGQLTRALAAALSENADLIIIPKNDLIAVLDRAALFSEIEKASLRIIGIETLSEIPDVLAGKIQPIVLENIGPTERVPSTEHTPLLPLNPELARVLGIASASRHHLLLLGAKGVGKSHALDWLIALQPKIDRETLKTQTFLSELSQNKLPPSKDTVYRRVSSQVRAASLLGSFHSHHLQPGEFSLAHGGVLLADEFPEWSRDSREVLREPLERGWITLTRVQGSIELPARFLFAGNGNLCPCGGIYSEKTSPHEMTCRCLPHHRLKYLNRLSGPILDRIDLLYVLKRDRPTGAETLENLRERVEKSRLTQLKLYGKPVGDLGGAEIEEILENEPSLKQHLDSSGAQSLRDRHKTFRIALSLAHWDEVKTPSPLHFLEARLYRGALLQTLVSR